MDPNPLMASHGYQWIFLICELVRATNSNLVTRTSFYLVTRTSFILVPELLITIFSYAT